jgi:hypothetical protein
METYTLPHFPPSVNTVHIALFEDVSNAPAIRKRLIQAATTDGEEGDRLKAEVDFGFLDGRMVSAAMLYCATNMLRMCHRGLGMGLGLGLGLGQSGDCAVLETSKSARILRALASG